IINANTINYNGFGLLKRIGGGNGIYIDNHATSLGSVLSQSLAIDDNVISHNAEHGILLHNDAREDGFISQFAVIDPNTIDKNGNDGIFISNFAFESELGSYALIADNFISGNGHNGIEIVNRATFAG